MHKWQPIDTAPPYGNLLLYDPNEGIWIGYRDQQGWMDRQAEFRLAPTHWMPLPSPPRPTTTP